MTPTNREELIALMVEASLGGFLVAGKPGQLGYDIEAQAMADILDALIAHGVAMVPVASDPEGIAATYDDAVRALDQAYRSTRRPDICGQTTDACFRAEFASAIAGYRAAIAAGRIDGGSTSDLKGGSDDAATD